MSKAELKKSEKNGSVNTPTIAYKTRRKMMAILDKEKKEKKNVKSQLEIRHWGSGKVQPLSDDSAPEKKSRKV